MYSWTELNQEQIKAVNSQSPVIIINAGPGTGKTKTLISRIAHLIFEKNINPSSILAITFTKKAAAEMKTRLKKIIPDKPMPYIGTFHSFAFEILSKEKEIKLVSEQTRKEIIEDILKNQQFSSISPKEANRTISLYKSKVKRQPDSLNTVTKVEEQLVETYSSSLKSNNFMDFDDILLEFYDLLQNSEKRQTLQNQYQHILVDEFQDSNEVQYEIIKKIFINQSPERETFDQEVGAIHELPLQNTSSTFFIIGDPLQSIYSFRGAGADMFSRIANDFPQAIQITLPINYRSAKHIVHVSSLLFPKHAKFIPNRTVNGLVSLIHTLHEYAEADFVLRTVGALVGGIDLIQAADLTDHTKNSGFADVAVIYRNHRVSTILQERFFNSGIPFQVIGAGSPYEQKEVQYIIDCLRFIYDKKHQSISNIDDYPFIKSQTDSDLLWLLYEKNAKLSSLIQKIAQHFGLIEQIKDKKEELRNLMQFQNAFTQFDTDPNPLENSIQYIQFLHDHEYYDPNCDKVTLLTMHASKGLEFKHVFVCGFEDEIIPGRKVDAHIEEEKRLLYVAMTRAKDSLYLLSSKSRNRKYTSVSRFGDFIKSKELIDREDDATDFLKKKIEKAKIKKSQMRLF